MKILVVLLVVMVIAVLVRLVLTLRPDKATERDTPEVALLKRNLPAYARAQHDRAERLERLLCEVRGEDEMMPALSSELRKRLDAELDR
ncbi:MAG TPA: hypothetical protein VK988_14505 [Acidimicrobiales bacterium]|nr:hypothetical protein [Acidimicrobiales bacterium]